MNNISISGGYGYLDGGFNSYMAAPGVYHNEYPEENIPIPIFNGPMASIAGIAKVGSKVSFVFDSMFMYVSEETTVTDYNETKPGYWDEINNVWVDPEFTYTVTAVSNTGIAMMFMPGLRFQKTEKNAFQFNLSGVALITDGDSESFPFPMCTWFIRF
ncbi:MAG: hypothetical protein C0596_00050 [Marinilabiliales bacterium]|nr:MAG: hypothetical protein C0596_00050 [Marinilabiliales bacterium]